jgi:hypothetical protein
MTVGDILDRGMKVLFARLPVFYAINLLVLFPIIAVQVAGPLVFLQGRNALDPGDLLASTGVNLLALLVTLILQPIATAAILHIVMEEYAGRRPTMGAALSFAVSRFFPLLLASFLVGMLVGLGTLLCCVPGLYFWATYAFVGQIVVLERLGVTESFQRSQTLVTGYRWRVFGVLILIIFATQMVEGSISVGLNLVLPAQEMIPVQNGVRIEVNPVNHIVDTVVVQLVGILFASYTAVCTTLLYLDLRIRKEGFDLELAAGGKPDDRHRDDRGDRDEYDDEYDDYDDRDYRDDRDDRGYGAASPDERRGEPPQLHDDTNPPPEHDGAADHPPAGSHDAPAPPRDDHGAPDRPRDDSGDRPPDDHGDRR